MSAVSNLCKATVDNCNLYRFMRFVCIYSVQGDNLARRNPWPPGLFQLMNYPHPSHITCSYLSLKTQILKLHYRGVGSLHFTSQYCAVILYFTIHSSEITGQRREDCWNKPELFLHMYKLKTLYYQYDLFFYPFLAGNMIFILRTQ